MKIPLPMPVICWPETDCLRVFMLDSAAFKSYCSLCCCGWDLVVEAGLALEGCSFLIYLEGWEAFLEVSGAD